MEWAVVRGILYSGLSQSPILYVTALASAKHKWEARVVDVKKWHHKMCTKKLKNKELHYFGHTGLYMNHDGLSILGRCIDENEYANPDISV